MNIPNSELLHITKSYEESAGKGKITPSKSIL